MRVFLPFPPSLNKLWKPVARGRLVRSPAYRAWINDATWVVFLAAREQGKVRGAYVLNVWLHPQAAKRLRDVDNFLKAPCDALVKGGAIEDDSLCQDLRVRWGDFDDPGVLLEIEPCNDQPSPKAGSARLPSETRKSPTRHQIRRVATIQNADFGEFSDTAKGALMGLASQPSSISAEDTACREVKKKPKT